MNAIFLTSRLEILIKYIIIALVQGVAEILPISSSGHMIIAQELLGIQTNDLSLEIFLHFGSLIAIFVFFRKKIWAIIRDFFLYLFKKKEEAKDNYKLAWYIVIATIPAAIAGLFLEDIIGKHLKALWVVGVFLLITSALLYLSTKAKREKELKDLTWKNALIIGLFQCLGLFPGISRSGSTLVGGASQKVKQTDAADFAFILALPIMLGSAVLSMNDISTALSNSDLLIPYLVGFIVTLITTYLTISLFFSFIKKKKMSIFSIYCLCVGLLIIVLDLTIV